MKGVVNKERKDEFARLVSAGVDKKDAYRQAFNKPELSDSAARQAAWRLSRNVTVAKKMLRLGELADSQAVMSRRERMELLSRKAAECDKAGDTGDMVKCIAELNKMDGAYEPERVEVKSELSLEHLLGEIGNM